MLKINPGLAISEQEVEVSAVRSRGAGGQHVNKVATAIHLRFDIRASTLPDNIKHRLLRLGDTRITRDGVIVIKAGEHRSQERNRSAAISRLLEIIRGVTHSRRRRKVTRPTVQSRLQRLEHKVRRGRLKQSRRRVQDHE